jgi:hypothetical protein
VTGIAPDAAPMKIEAATLRKTATTVSDRRAIAD